MDICNVYLFITCLNSLITLGRNEILLCGMNKLQFYDTTRQQCDNGIVLPLSTSDENASDRPTRLPKWYFCGSSMTRYDVAVHECIDGSIVLKNMTNTTKDSSYTTSKPDISPLTDNSFEFIDVVAGAVGFVLVCFVVLLVLFLMLWKYYLRLATVRTDPCPV